MAAIAVLIAKTGTDEGLVAQLVQPLLAAAGQSSIVLISSVAGGPASIKSGTLYAMTKGAAL